MKSVNVQMTDVDGNVVNEKTIELQEGSNIIVKIPTSYMDSPDMVEAIYEGLQNFGTGNLLVIPQDIEIYILNIKI